MIEKNNEPSRIPNRDAGDVLFFRFIGRLLALISHELNNHLAILRESIGLADDIIGAKNIPEKKRWEELTVIVRSLDEKLNRPAALVRHMGDVSHQIEQERAERDADLIVDRLLSFVQRTAGQKKITLHKSLTGRQVRLSLDPLELQFVLFAILDNLFSALATGGRVSIDTAQSGMNYIIRITAEQFPHSVQESEPWSQDAISGMIDRGGGTLHYGEGGRSITLTFPIMQSC